MINYIISQLSRSICKKMVNEQNGEIILDNAVRVTPLIKYFCKKCMKNLSRNQFCFDCSSLTYEIVINLGYYTPRWYNQDDAFLDTSIRRRSDLQNINPKYKFCKLINDAKARNEENTTPNKKNIIEILCNGFIWKVKKYDSWILSQIDLIIHVPKKNENPQKDKKDRTFFNHGYYYALLIANGLGITFDQKIITEDQDSMKDNRLFSIFNLKKIQNKKIMIIDDVYTNGHTKGRISSLLMENGTSKVYIGVIARTIA